MDHIDIPHIHQYISTASMPALMVLLRSPTNVNTSPMTGINSSLYTIFNIDTISVGVTPPLGHLELNVTDPNPPYIPQCLSSSLYSTEPSLHPTVSVSFPIFYLTLPTSHSVCPLPYILLNPPYIP